MTEQKNADFGHAPGPWKAGFYKKDGVLERLAVWPETMADGEKGPTICLLAPISNLTVTDEANARLIAAAPELLEALDFIANGFDLQIGKQWREIVNEFREVARAAIAKATSQSQNETV